MEAAIERILISPESLKTRVSTLAGEIADAFGEAPDGVTIVATLSGSIIFLADLIGELPMRMRIGLVPVSSDSDWTLTACTVIFPTSACCATRRIRDRKRPCVVCP